MLKTVIEVIQKLFGVNVFDLNATYSVGTSPIQVATANPGRLEITFNNLSSNSIYVAPFENVTSSNGFLLTANGGMISPNFQYDGLLSTREWWAIASSAGSTLYKEEINILS